MGGIAQYAGQRMQAAQAHEHEEERQAANEKERVGIHMARVFALLVGKAEEACLHAESEKHEHQRREGVDV